MQIPLLNSKMTFPSRGPFVIPRKEASSRLDISLDCHSALICAPSGYGKTVLASEWALDKKTAWLRLDESDKSTPTFFQYLIGALRKIIPSFAEDLLEILPSLAQYDIDSFLIRLVNETEKITDKTVLILDNYHLVSGTIIDQYLKFIIENKSNILSLIIISQKEPEIPIETWLAKNRIEILGVNELKLTQEEAKPYFKKISGKIISDEELN